MSELGLQPAISGKFIILSVAHKHDMTMTYFTVSRGKKAQVIEIPIGLVVQNYRSRDDWVLEIKEYGEFKVPIWRDTCEEEKAEIDNCAVTIRVA